MSTVGLRTSNLMGLFALAIFSQSFIINFPPNNAKQIWEKSANNNLIPTLHLQARSLLQAAGATLAPQVPLQLHPQQSSSWGLRGGSDPELHAESRGIKHQILSILLFFTLICKSYGAGIDKPAHSSVRHPLPAKEPQKFTLRQPVAGLTPKINPLLCFYLFLPFKKSEISLFNSNSPIVFPSKP